MASNQQDNKGATPKTTRRVRSCDDNQRENVTGSKNPSFDPITNKTETARNVQGRENHDSQHVLDVERDSEPIPPQPNVSPVPPQFSHPDFVDLAVIYVKEDFCEVTTHFIPWLSKMAKECCLHDAGIYRYDDPAICHESNIFSQAENVSAKCMKILVFVTDNLKKNKLMKGLVQDLIMLTRFITEDQAEKCISKIRKALCEEQANYLSECVQRQKGNALIPVQTAKGKVIFLGLESIIPIPFYDLDDSAAYKRWRTQGVIREAISSRQWLYERIIANPRNRSSFIWHSGASSRENQHTTVISGNSLRRDQQHNVVYADNTEQSLDQENENKTESRTANVNDVCIQGNSTLNTSAKTKTPVHSDLAAAPPPSDGDDPPQDDLENDKFESGIADESEIKKIVPRSASTESDYNFVSELEQRQQVEKSKPVKESGESSLENAGLVNDSGEAALGKEDSDDTYSKSLKEESMLSTDAQRVEGMSLLYSRKRTSKLEDQSEVREHTLTYTGMPESRGLMAGNVPHKDAGRGSPVGSDTPDSTTQMKGKQPPDFSHTLLPYIIGTNEGPVLTIVHHHLYGKSETKEAAAPSPPPKPTEKVPRTINVIGANTVMIGSNNESVMTKPTISNINPDSDEPEPEVVPTTHQTTQKDMQLDSGAEFPSSTPTTNPGSINNLSPSLQHSNYNFPKSAEPTNEWKKTDYKKVEGKNAADEKEGRKKEDSCDDSSSDEDNSLVGTDRPTGDVPEGNLETIKARNWNDMEEQNQITSDSGLFSSSWQSEAEDNLGTSLSDDLVSLVACQGDTLQQPDDGDQWDAVKSNHSCITTGKQSNAAEGQGQGQTGVETCGEETLPFVTGGPQPVNSLHTMSLFESTLSVLQQFHTGAGTLKTNAFGMLAHNTMFLQEVTRVDHHKQDGDVD